MESFWSRVQVEHLDRQGWSTRLELATALFEYLGFFHNRQRRHSSLGMLTPVEFEARQGAASASVNADVTVGSRAESGNQACPGRYGPLGARDQLAHRRERSRSSVARPEPWRLISFKR
jgi:hypothetical protein